MITYLQPQNAQFMAHFEHVTTIYVKQIGAGNLRLASSREDLQSTVGNTVPDGIPQAAADGVKQYFWEGDLWVISDAAGPVMMYVPSYSFYVDRLRGNGDPNTIHANSEIEGNLSTY